jgi:biopolymer transport protein ExbD
MSTQQQDQISLEEDWQPVLPHSAPRDEAEMDITPMIDITFLLLIFFLVTSQPDESTKVDLPEARYGRGVSQRQAVIFSVIQGGGRDLAPVYLGDGQVSQNRIDGDARQQADRIETEVRKALLEGHPNVIIKAEKGVAHREVARVSGAASRVEGIRRYFAVLEVD